MSGGKNHEEEMTGIPPVAGIFEGSSTDPFFPMQRLTPEQLSALREEIAKGIGTVPECIALGLGIDLTAIPTGFPPVLL